MKKILSIAAASFLAAGLLIGCGSSSSKDDNGTNPNPNPDPVNPKKCVYAPSLLNVIKDGNLTAELNKISVKDGTGKALESNTTILAGVDEVNVSTFGEYNVTASNPSCDNNATIKVIVKKKEDPVDPDNGNSVDEDGFVDPF